MTVAANVAHVCDRIAAAARRVGRDPSTITLVGVTKGHPVARAREALEAGVRHLGENRVADLNAKHGVLRAARWHLVGQLQTNKVARLPDGLHAVHSVDRTSLVDRLARRFADHPVPELFVEVNVGGEPTKAGVAPEGLGNLLDAMTDAGLAVAGLMTVAPLVADPEAVRPVFAQLAALAARHSLRGLSMGMTDDFEVAVEEGATVVRIGRAIFGERPVVAGRAV